MLRARRGRAEVRSRHGLGSKRRWLGVGMIVLALTITASSAVALSARSQEAARVSSVKSRCCFEITVTAGTHLHVDYNVDGPTAGNYPQGIHEVDAQWVGHQIFEYSEYNGRPVITGLLGGGARFWAWFEDTGQWTFSGTAGDSASCIRDTLTDPSFPSSQLHWLDTVSFLHFVDGGRLIRVAVDRGPRFSGAFSKCGLGISSAGTSAAKSAWDGLNQPWSWTIKDWTRNQWRHAPSLERTVKQYLPVGLNVMYNGHVERVRSASLIVSIDYFPRRRLAAEAKSFRAMFPLDSPGMRLVVDDESRG
jgi:hypothetical protein